jgi:hypothetical protein
MGNRRVECPGGFGEECSGPEAKPVDTIRGRSPALWGISLSMLGSLLVATGMVTLTVTVHFLGTVGLLQLLRNRPRRKRRTALFSQGAAILFIVLSLMTLHGAQIWLYAGLYYFAGALPDLETALYFSTVSYTTVGYGDIVLAPGWRLVGAVESANGLLLFGWSTAFLTTTTAQLSTLEANWLQEGTGEARTS